MIHTSTSEDSVPPSLDANVNDFTIQVATVNGSGSQTANTVLLRSVFQMGVPVSGKNLFPSNIQGLPTWFTIRASKHGYIGRKKEVDVLVALNPETGIQDIQSLEPGRVVVYNQPLNLKPLRDDLLYYPVPFDDLVVPICPKVKFRPLVKNMIYVGVLANLLSIDMDEVERALSKQLGKKQAVLDMNRAAVQTGFDFALKNLVKTDPYSLERMKENEGKIIIDGNSAAALGCLFAGVTVVAWYPITPSSSLCEALIDYMKSYRMDPDTGRATFAIIQAEDELAALGMVLGAGWAGARAMTASSGPGLSLMAEFAGLGYYAEIPSVIFNIQRVGPSTGLPTRTMQGDLMAAAFLSHGDTRHILLYPGSVEECYSMAMEAFDLAETFQTPVIVMSDLDLGMNNWMADPFPYPESALKRGKILTEKDLQRTGRFERYRDVDGDGIPYRTIPGSSLPAYFCRGSGHNERAQYTERPDDYQRNIDRLARKFETARAHVPEPEVFHEGAGEVAVVGYGSSHHSILETLDQLRGETGIDAGYLRIRAYPFHPTIETFISRYRRLYVIDQNRDGQMRDLLRLSVRPDLSPRLRSIRHYDGLPITAREITDMIVHQEDASHGDPRTT